MKLTFISKILIENKRRPLKEWTKFVKKVRKFCNQKNIKVEEGKKFIEMTFGSKRHAKVKESLKKLLRGGSNGKRN